MKKFVCALVVLAGLLAVPAPAEASGVVFGRRAVVVRRTVVVNRVFVRRAVVVDRSFAFRRAVVVNHGFGFGAFAVATPVVPVFFAPTFATFGVDGCGTSFGFRSFSGCGR